jgi:protein-tyrosine phosphatase
VCTGNICRSPMAAGLLAARLTERGIDASVVSTGITAEGRPATDPAIEVMRRTGVDLGAHRSRRLDRSQVASADLVVGLERQHVREVAVLDPGSFRRAFTLRELVRRGEQCGPRGAEEDLVDWLARIGHGRSTTDLLGTDRDDDVEDPYGRSVDDYAVTAEELVDLVDRLVDLVWPAELAQARAQATGTAG